MPSFPLTWRVVLRVSMGMRKIRKEAAAAEAATVLTAMGSERVDSFDSNNARIPELAAVSPKLDNSLLVNAT